MSTFNILATLQNHCHVPPKSIFRGKNGNELKVDFYYDDTVPVTFRTPIFDGGMGATPTLFVGVNQSSASQTSGTIREVHIWPTPLTDTQMKQVTT